MISQKSQPRLAGLLAPVFALRHDDDFGIGDTFAVRQAIDFCAARSFAVLQILPIHETFEDPSPYSPISSKALSPALLSLTPEEVPGLTHEDLTQLAPDSWRTQLRNGIVKHGSVHSLKLQVLFQAHRRFIQQSDEALAAEFTTFKNQEQSWLRHYLLYRLLIREYEGNPNWLDWRPEHHSVAGAESWLARHTDREALERTMDGLAFAQWVGVRQWLDVRKYAETKGVQLMGEMSFGVGSSSADVWANPQLFELDWNMGTPPMASFDTTADSARWGQNWGFPPYRWENHRATGFAWLRSRIAFEKRFFHICRLDHLRGYFRAYMFPWSAGPRHAEFANLTAEEAALRTGGLLPRFIPGPDTDPITAGMNDLQGREIISILRDEAGSMELYAEIMGQMAGYIRKAIDDLQLANLVFPQLEGLVDGLPGQWEEGTFRELSLISYGNHDHAPLALLYEHLRQVARNDPSSEEAKKLDRLMAFANWTEPRPDFLTDDLLFALQTSLFKSRCKFAVLTASDLYGIPVRYNLPGSYGLETWCSRLEFSFPDYERHPLYGSLADRVGALIRETDRVPSPAE
jgi:4-alpha-glucanotransferase